MHKLLWIYRFDPTTLWQGVHSLVADQAPTGAVLCRTGFQCAGRVGSLNSETTGLKGRAHLKSSCAAVWVSGLTGECKRKKIISNCSKKFKNLKS
jgi:hypothetical protein